MALKKKKRKTLIVLLALLLAYGLWTQAYHYDQEKAALYISTHHLKRSHTCCAWYVMRAMQAGGCPVPILPAWAYKYALPIYGFEQVPAENHKPLLGDIVVFAAVDNHYWGHIAMYDGTHWISDFKQRSMFVYKRHNGYAIFRPKAK